MINSGDVFITKLERGFFGAFRVLKTGGRFDFAKNEEFYLIALTSYADTVKPGINDKRLREPLREKRLSFRGIPHINIYANPKNIIEKHFEFLGNLPLTKEEGKFKIQIGDGEHVEYGGGFPLAGAVQKDFGFEAFLEWRWEHENELYKKEIQENKEQREKAAQEKKMETKNSLCVSAAYRFKDGKSDKFWRIEYAGSALAVNYGKAKTTGKYQVKEFDNQEECEKEAKKLIASKEKKGYKPYAEFDPDNHLYFDDEETGLHPLTSPPNFRKRFSDDLYYDCGDEEAPFGSDEGSDTLHHLEEDIRKGNVDFASYPQKLIEEYWDMTYLPPDDISLEAVKALVKPDKASPADEGCELLNQVEEAIRKDKEINIASSAKSDEIMMNLTQSDMVTYAVAFAQIKITGRIDPALKTAALNAMRRMEITAELSGWNKSGQPSEITTLMINDLEGF